MLILSTDVQSALLSLGYMDKKLPEIFLGTKHINSFVSFLRIVNRC